jgi:two-component system cell cycle sensor histidine kinase/response regulator CckA
MTQEIKAKIFKPFFTPMFAGRGLGLAPVQGIIRGHGGTINVVSALGEGSRSKILLPCNRPPAQDTQDIGVSANRKARGRSETVLVIEDEEVLRVIVAKVLRERGFSVIETGDGKAGVDLFQKNESEVSVVVLDITLPSLSGREVLVQLRRIRPDVKVILTSAYSEDMASLRFDGQRPWHFLRKPYRLGDLVELIRDAVG